MWSGVRKNTIIHNEPLTITHLEVTLSLVDLLPVVSHLQLKAGHQVGKVVHGRHVLVP